MTAAHFNSVQSMHSFVQYTFTEHPLLPRHCDRSWEIQRVYLIEGGGCQGSGHSAVATGGSDSGAFPVLPAAVGRFPSSEDLAVVSGHSLLSEHTPGLCFPALMILGASTGMTRSFFLGR